MFPYRRDFGATELLKDAFIVTRTIAQPHWSWFRDEWSCGRVRPRGHRWLPGRTDYEGRPIRSYKDTAAMAVGEHRTSVRASAV